MPAGRPRNEDRDRSQRRTLTVAEVAVDLDVSEPTVTAAVRAGQLPGIAVGARVLILKQPYEAMMSGKPASPAPNETANPAEAGA